MTPVPPSPELSLVGSLHPTPPTSEAACWPISANRGMTSEALTLWPVSGTCPGAAVYLRVLKVGSNLDVINNSYYLINFYQPLRFMSSWRIIMILILYTYIVHFFLQNPPTHLLLYSVSDWPQGEQWVVLLFYKTVNLINLKILMPLFVLADSFIWSSFPIEMSSFNISSFDEL